MNSKLLFAATVAISLVSTWALADETAAPAKSRAEVQAELNAAIADHTLVRTDYELDARASAGVSTKNRTQVAVELAADKAARRKLVGPLANRTYNPAGTAVLASTSTLTRAEVKNDVLQAAAAGTLQRTDYDDPNAVVVNRAHVRSNSPTLAQRLKGAWARLQS